MDSDFEAFCRREHARLVGCLDLMTGSLDVAEDLAQEALARAWRDWPRVRQMAAPGAYVHRIAMNLAVSMFRRRASERRAHDRHASGRTDVWSDPDAADAEAVRASLARLPAHERQTLVARYYLSYSVAETAQLLGVPEGTVKVRTQRGLTRLRQVLDVDVTAQEVGRA